MEEGGATGASGAGEPFDLDAFLADSWNVFTGRQRHDVVVEFAAAVAPLVANARHHPGETTKRLPNGAVEYRVTLAALPGGRSHVNAATFVFNDKLIVLGGETAYMTQVKTVYAYDPLTNQWSLLGTLPSVRSSSIAGVLSGNRIISATGNNPDATSTTWIGTVT